jgi:O-antigen/teichoic acid export membrane protein
MREVSKNFVSLFISDAASRILGFVGVVYIARLLTIEGFGLVNYGLAFLTYALLFANPGLTTIGAREIAKDHINRKIIEEVLGLRVLFALIIFIIFIVGLKIIPGQPETKKVILVYLFSLFPFAVLLEFVFQGREEMEYIGISRLVQYGVYVGLLLVFLGKGQGILVVPTSFFVGCSVAATFLIIVFFSKYKSLRLKFSFSSWRRLLIISTPVGLATIFNQVSLNLPPIFLGVFYSKIEVGLFSAGYKIIIMLLIIERVFHYVFFPIISKQYSRSPEKLKSSFTFLTRLLFAITVPLALGGIILANKIILFIFGSGYETAVNVFRILLLYFLISPINSIFGYGLISIEREWQFFKVITITAIINVILIVILGIYVKSLGVAYALFISEMIGLVLMNKELRKSVQFKSVKYLVKPIIATIIVGTVLYVCRDFHIMVLLVLGIFVYLLSVYFIKLFTKDELRDIKQAFSVKKQNTTSDSF